VGQTAPVRVGQQVVSRLLHLAGSQKAVLAATTGRPLRQAWGKWNA
jgi:hypothetical protein